MRSWSRASGRQRQTSRRSDAEWWGRRGLAFALVVCLHLAVLALLALQPPARPFKPDYTPVVLSLGSGSPGRVEPTGGGSAASSALQPSDRPSPRPVEPPPTPSAIQPSPSLSPIAVIPSPLLMPSPRPAAAPAAPTAAASPTPPAAQGGGCNIETALQARLGGDPAVLSALRSLPPEAKSVANAIQLWDGGWVTPAKLDAPELLVPVEQAIVQAVSAAPSGCAGQDVRGPRLIILSKGDDTFIISLGSGVWRWTDLLEPSLPNQFKK